MPSLRYCMSPSIMGREVRSTSSDTWMTRRGGENDLPIFAANPHKAGLLMNVFLLGPKQLLVVASYEGFQLTFHPLAAFMGAFTMPIHQGPGYIRLARPPIRCGASYNPCWVLQRTMTHACCN